MDNRKSNALKIVIVSAIAVVLLVAILIVVGVFDKNGGIFSDGQDKKVLEYEGESYVLKDGVETFLVMGLDKLDSQIVGDSYNNNQQADFLMLMVFDNNSKTYSTIHINRDTVAEIEVLGLSGDKVGVVNTQIALAHTYGKGGSISNSNSAKAVSKLLYDVKVNHYMSLTLDSIGVMNDLVDGVEVELLEDFSNLEVEGAEELYKGNKVTLNAEQARLYVQHRQELSDSSNATRMERQQQYLEAMRKEIELRIENDNQFLADAVIKMSDYIDSDCSSTRLQEIGKKMQEYEFIEINEIEGESKIGADGHMEFYPNENSLKKLVIDLFYVPKK